MVPGLIDSCENGITTSSRGSFKMNSCTALPTDPVVF